jgi:hypothetical protein
MFSVFSVGWSMSKYQLVPMPQHASTFVTSHLIISCSSLQFEDLTVQNEPHAFILMKLHQEEFGWVQAQAYAVVVLLELVNRSNLNSKVRVPNKYETKRAKRR